MRSKSLFLLFIALGCGLVASIGVSQVLGRHGERGRQPVETVAIYVAKSDINLGESLTSEVLNLEAWPKDKVPYGSITNLESLVGRRLRTKIYQGEPILAAKLVDKDAIDSPAQQVPPGYRVVSVRVSAHTGVAGLLRPGDRVDVQLFAKKDPRTGIVETVTKTVLREIRVFAVDQEFRRASDQDEPRIVARTVSLVVTPEQANKLTLATKLGEIHLTMRNPDDLLSAGSDGATIESLLTSSRGNRYRERGLVKETLSQGAQSISSWLTGIKQAVSRTTAKGVVTPGWTMLVLEGDAIRQVEFDQNGRQARGMEVGLNRRDGGWGVHSARSPLVSGPSSLRDNPQAGQNMQEEGAEQEPDEDV